MIAADFVHGHGRSAAVDLMSDAEAIRCRELRRSGRLRNDARALAEADAVTQRLVDSVLAPVVAFLLANDRRPEVVVRVRELVLLRSPEGNSGPDVTGILGRS